MRRGPGDPPRVTSRAKWGCVPDATPPWILLGVRFERCPFRLAHFGLIDTGGYLRPPRALDLSLSARMRRISATILRSLFSR